LTPRRPRLVRRFRKLDQLSDLRQSESCRAHQAHEASVKASIGAVIEVLDSQIDAIQHAIDALNAIDPILTEKASLLRSCKGVGPKNAQMILAHLPEIGALDRRKIAALVGVAPITCKSGSSINRASIAGGRKPLRDTLFMAALSASSHNPTFIAFRDRLKANGKPHKLIIVAVIRKLIVTLNAMIKAKTPFKPALT
jgi:transposase